MWTRSLCVFIFWGFHLVSEANTLEVCGKCMYQDIHQPVQDAKDGDTVRVSKGVYLCESLEITKRLTLIGEPGSILDGNESGYVLKLLADSIVVSGFEIRNTKFSYTNDFAAIYIFRANHFVISNNNINHAFFGLLIEKSHGGVVNNNIINGRSTREDDSGNGIHLWHCNNIVIEGNEVSGMRDGIYLEFVDQSKILNNYTHENVRYGLHFMFSNHDEYVGNTFRKNGAGVAVMFSKWILMKDNYFLENWGTASYGLLLKEIYDGVVEGNHFEMNTIGIFIDGSTRIVYKENTIRQNGWAIKVSGGCYANRFIQNNFIGNSFEVSYNARLNDNEFDNNYWSDYTGYDLNKDGIGDVPYRPVKLFSYIVNRTPETIVLLRSLFVDLINFSERVSPVFTPDDLVDESPSLTLFQ